MKPLVAVVGPTAAGKSEAAIEIALRHRGEVVNADSRLLYQGLEIGSATPTDSERRGTRHHLIGFVQPDQAYSVAAFLDSARRIIDDITARERLPVMAGGTGQYAWGLIEGWNVPKTPPDTELRQRLERKMHDEGLDSLVRRLQELDPEVTRLIDVRNPRRVIRAIERAMAGKTGVADRRPPDDLPYDTLIIGLTAKRDALHRRIENRIEAMIQRGWADEVKTLLKAGVHDDAPAMSAIGYRDVAKYVRGEIEIGELKSLVAKATRRLVRRQYNWFKLTDPRIVWIQAGPGAAEDAAKVTCKWLRSRKL